MTNEENMQMQDAVRNGVITYEQYIDWLRQADPNGVTAPSRESFNNNIFGGLGGGNGLADFVRMIGAVYGQNPVAYLPENPPAQKPWTYKANPYTPEYIQHMKDTGMFAPNPAHTITLSDGTPYLVPESKNDMFGSFSPHAPVPSYLGDMNLLVAAMNHVNSGGTDNYYTDVINRYKSNPNLLMSGVNQVDTMLDQAYSRIQQNPNDQWAKTTIDLYEPQRSAYKPMMQQFNAAFQQWQPNPGYGTSWQQTETPWQGMAQWLEQAQYGKQATGGGNFGGGNYKQNFADMYQQPQQNQGWTPYNNYPNNWQPNPQYQTQPYPSGGGAPVGYGQPYIGKPAIENDKPQYLPVANGAKGLHSQQGTMPAKPEPSYRSWARR